MLGRHVRRQGLRLIENALEKAADVSAPTLATMKAKKTRELGAPPMPDAGIPKVVSFPAS